MWFPGEDSSPFLEQVRVLAPESLSHLIQPWQTSAFAYAGCLLMVDLADDAVVGKYGSRRHLQVAWDDGVLSGYWGDKYLWDDFDERDDEAMVVRGLSLTDDEAADAAITWFARQLGRPLNHQVWKRRSRVVAQRWVLADTGRELGRRGRWRTSRKNPTEVTQLRPERL